MHLPRYSVAAMRRHMTMVARNRRAFEMRAVGMSHAEIDVELRDAPPQHGDRFPGHGSENYPSVKYVASHERHEAAVREQRCLICRAVWVHVTARRLQRTARTHIARGVLLEVSP